MSDLEIIEEYKEDLPHLNLIKKMNIKSDNINVLYEEGTLVIIVKVNEYITSTYVCSARLMGKNRHIRRV